MEGLQEKKKKGSMLKKTWERCKSLGHGQMQVRAPPTTILSMPTSPDRPMVKSKSWSTLCPSTPLSPRFDKLVGCGSSKNLRASPLSPKGCLSVYVGPDKQRFVIKIGCTNHPLFRMLLEEAELEYGFHCNGPLMLPCEVDFFIKVLYEMEADDLDDNSHSSRCRLPRSRSSYHILSPPSRLIA